METLTPARRRYIYGVSLALLPLLIALGVITDELAPLIVAALGAILVPGLAAANVTKPADLLPDERAIIDDIRAVEGRPPLA